MGDYDTTFKRLAAARPKDMARLFLGYRPRALTPIPGDLPAMRHELDFAARIGGARRRFILHVECERQPGPGFARRLLEYHALLHARERLPVLSAVLSFRGRARARPLATEQYRYEVAGERPIVFRYRVFHLPAIEAQRLLDLGLPGLFPLVPLARHGTERAVLAEAVSAIRRRAPEDVRADLTAALAVFAGVAGNRKLVYDLVRIEEMKKSVIYQDILAEGRAQGVAEGRAQGVAEGRAQGIAEGRAEAVLRVLGRRFGRVPEEVRRRVLAERSIERLDALMDRALDAPSLESFAAPLREEGGATPRMASNGAGRRRE